MKNKEDPRIRRTHRFLREALTSLILEKDYASISIKEITERADVAYITFFRHYQGIDELLMEVLDAGLADLLGNIEALASQSGELDNEMEGRLIFEYVDQKSDLFRILFKSQSAARIRIKVVRNISAIFQKSCTPLRDIKSQIPIQVATNHMATSLLALIEWWLENKMSPTPPQMGRIYKGLIIDSTIGAVIALKSISK